MSVTLQCLNPSTGALYGNAIVFAPPSPLNNLLKSSQISNMIQAIPTTTHIAVPMGEVGPTIQMTGRVHTVANFTELRQWWPSNWYVQVTASTVPYEMPVGSIWLIDNVLTKRSKGYLDWWDITLLMTQEFSFEAQTGAPIPFIPTTPTLRSDGVLGVDLYDIGAATTVTVTPWQIQYQLNGQKDASPIPESRHIQIPLGVEGPYITLDAYVQGAQQNIMQNWTFNTAIAITNTSYLEFDVNNPTTYYSVWLVNSAKFNRLPTYVAETSTSNQRWAITLSLVRYWGWELFN